MSREVQDNNLKLNLRKLNDRTSTNIHNYKNYTVGRVLTVVDAAISDVEQRKAVKDLVTQAIWEGEYHTTGIFEDITSLCQAEGYGDLYDRDTTEDKSSYPREASPFIERHPVDDDSNSTSRN